MDSVAKAPEFYSGVSLPDLCHGKHCSVFPIWVKMIRIDDYDEGFDDS